MILTKAFLRIGLLLSIGFLPASAQMVFQLRAGGSYLGVNLADIDADRAKALKLKDLSGVEITAVQDGGAASQAGIRPGDVLLSYNGEKLLGAQQLIRLVSETPPGRRVEVLCWRAGQSKQMLLTTGQYHPVSQDDSSFISNVRVTDVPSPMLLWRNILLGIESESLNDQLAQAFGVKQGILIWAVEGGSIAQHGGLRAGDILTDFCGHAIRSPREVGLVLQQLETGQKPMSVSVIRDHKSITLSFAVDTDR
jgi:serine protease Do